MTSDSEAIRDIIESNTGRSAVPQWFPVGMTIGAWKKKAMEPRMVAFQRHEIDEVELSDHIYINLARVYGGTDVGSCMVRVMAMQDPFYNVAEGWFREGAKMAIEVCERAWYEANQPGGPYRTSER